MPLNHPFVPAAVPEVACPSRSTTTRSAPRRARPLKLLRDRGLEPRIIEYLKTPPGKAELARLTGMLGIRPRALLRTREPEYKAAKLGNPKLSDSAILAAMVKYPKLIERPIVVKGKKAALGRPPENVLKIL